MGIYFNLLEGQQENKSNNKIKNTEAIKNVNKNNEEENDIVKKESYYPFDEYGNKTLSRNRRNNIAFIEAATEEYEKKLEQEDDESNSFYHDNPEYESDGLTDLMQREASERVVLGYKREGLRKRKASFFESVTNALLADSIMKVYSEAMNPNLLNKPGIETMMRALTSQFILEDANEILSKMRRKSATLSEMYNLITDTKKKITEDVNETLKANGDADSFKIKSNIKDEFFDKLNDLDTESISEKIRERVAAATEKFMIDNANDHDKIVQALQLTKDKLDEIKGDDKEEVKEVKESYERMSKRFIGKIRNRKKSVFESMVTAVCESTLKSPELKNEFMEGAKLNIGKIVDRVETMYTFIETVNTMQLYPVDESYMLNLIENLRHPAKF